LATLPWNLLHVDRNRPAAIKASLTVDYIEGHGWTAEQEGRETAWRLRATALVAADADVSRIVVRTNILVLHDNGDLFAYRTHGAVLSCLAYFLSGGFAKAYVASSYSPDNLGPWGSHPLLDPFYSSGHMTIDHDGLQMSRFEKTALVSGWPVALDNMLVCTNANYGGPNNCGQCEKCVRTMTALVALGKLSECGSFPERDVSTDLLRSVFQYVHGSSRPDYAELVGPLEARARPDLAAAIRESLAG
jgi:hypothetical protein